MRHQADAQVLGGLLGDALRSTGYSQKSAALDLGLDEAQLSRWIAGEAHMQLDRLVRLDRHVLRVFVMRLAEDLGVLVVPDAVVELLAVIGAQLAARQAKATVTGRPVAQRRIG